MQNNISPDSVQAGELYTLQLPSSYDSITLLENLIEMCCEISCSLLQIKTFDLENLKIMQ